MTKKTIDLSFTGQNDGLESGSLHLVLYNRKPGGSCLSSNVCWRRNGCMDSLHTGTRFIARAWVAQGIETCALIKTSVDY